MRVPLILIVAAALSACSPEPAAPVVEPTPTEVARQNFKNYVELAHSGERWDIGLSCFAEDMPEDKAKCYAS